MSEPPLPDFAGDPSLEEAPRPGCAPTLVGFPESWDPALVGLMKLLRSAIDSGHFSDANVADRLQTFEKEGAAGLAGLYAKARGESEAVAEKTEGWGCVHEEAVLAGVSCLWTSWPGQPSDARPILWLHGGAYNIGSHRSYRAFAARLSGATGCRVCVPNYRLAPENPYPAALDDVEQVWVAMDEGCTLGGDSAGGGLALALLHRLVEKARPLPHAAVLLAPWCDLSLTAASYDANASVDFIDRNTLRLGSRTYSGGLDPATHAGVSPLLGAMEGLPPLLIQVGSCDVLLDESLELAQRVKAAGGSVRLEVAAGMPHVYACLAAVSPRGVQAFADVAAFLGSI